MIRFLESDDAWHKLVEHLRTNTPLGRLNGIESDEVFRCLRKLGYRIAEPDKHPSGQESTEAATTEILTPTTMARLHADAGGRRYRR